MSIITSDLKKLALNTKIRHGMVKLEGFKNEQSWILEPEIVDAVSDWPPFLWGLFFYIYNNKPLRVAFNAISRGWAWESQLYWT